MVVKVARQFDYAGEFKVELVLPPNVKGVAADEVTIPAGPERGEADPRGRRRRRAGQPRTT